MAVVVQQQQDHFDRLPDALLVLIFNKLLDAKALSLCLCVCKRFCSLIPQIDSLFLTIPPRNIPTSKQSNERVLTSLRVFFNWVIAKPFKLFRRVVALKSTSNKSGSCSYPCLINVLKKFEDLKFIHFRFPYYVNGNGIELVGGDCLVKWKAEFGRHLKSCIILGATSCENCVKRVNGFQDDEEDEQFLTDDQLKLRIVWTISCLIAASARHHFLKQILAEHPRLERAVISDEKNQGRFCMGQEELAEMKDCMVSLSSSKASMERTPLPDLNIKLMYAPVLELPASGCTMRGATLVVIRPVREVVRREASSDGNLLGSGFDGNGEEKVFEEAVKEMMKIKKSYVMTMNSF